MKKAHQTSISLTDYEKAKIDVVKKQMGFLKRSEAFRFIIQRFEVVKK